MMDNESLGIVVYVLALVLSCVSFLMSAYSLWLNMKQARVKDDTGRMVVLLEEILREAKK